MKNFIEKYKAEIRIGVIAFIVVVLSQIINHLLK
jgi:hypothetical protein